MQQLRMLHLGLTFRIIQVPKNPSDQSGLLKSQKLLKSRHAGYSARDPPIGTPGHTGVAKMQPFKSTRLRLQQPAMSSRIN